MNAVLPWLGSTTLLAAALAAGQMLWWSVAATEPTVPEGVRANVASIEQMTSRPATATEERAMDASVILARPIFAPSRRPVVPQPDPLLDEIPLDEFELDMAAFDVGLDEDVEITALELEAVELVAPAPTRPKIEMMGAVGDDGRYRVLLSIDGQRPEWMTEGDAISLWRIVGAGPDWIDIGLDGSVERLEMYQ